MSLYGMENSFPVQIKQFPQLPAETIQSGPYMALHSSGNATKPPQLIKVSFTLYKYYDIIFSCIYPVNKGMLLQQSVFSFICSKDVLF